MSFLAPLFLLGALGMAIPLAIHLIKRDKPPRIHFSTLRFFRPHTRKQFLFQRFQQWLLLLLRSLVVLLLALAFARPFFSQDLPALGDLAPRSVSILLDSSMSMAYGDQLERGKERAHRILDDLNPGDEASLVIFADGPRAVHGPTSDLGQLRAALEDLGRAEYRSTRYFPALRLADELLEESQLQDRGIHLISDFQETGMEGFESGWQLAPGVDLRAEDVGVDKSRNLAVTGLRAPAYLRGSAGEEELFLRLRSLGSERVEEARVSVEVDGREQWQDEVVLGDQSEAVVRIPVEFTGEGSRAGRIRVEGDDFPRDNDFYFSVDLLPKIGVLSLNGRASEAWYEDGAHWFGLAVSGENSPFEHRVIEPGEFGADDLENQQVVALLNVAQLSEGQAAALETFVRSGGGLLIAPGDQLRPDNFNQELAGLSPARVAEPGRLEASDYLLIAERDERHPVLRPLQLDWNLRFNDYWRLQADEAADRLMTFDNGDAALLAGAVGEGRSLMFAASLDLQWSNLPLQGSYLPLVHESLKYLAGTPRKQAFYELGERLPVSESETLLDPEGTALTMREGERGYAPGAPGIYTARDDSDNERFYAANHPLDESDLSRMASSALVDRVLNPDTEAGRSPEVRTQLLKEELEAPQRLWWWLLLAVAALLLWESFLANRTHR